ncbi:hypothetical protein ACFFX0_23575 [Citricoccus parietis]|uniref:Uncharacterized protein n=1 Tax=Citricoccus parietis TaxID=592307 RepID=A0ABV5G500_9MICC
MAQVRAQREQPLQAMVRPPGEVVRQRGGPHAHRGRVRRGVSGRPSPPRR